jgi:prepilin-type N-terminal cleavage/methylation domain-containing protein
MKHDEAQNGLADPCHVARRPDAGSAGFTLPELLVTTVVMLVLLSLVTNVFIESNRVYDDQSALLEERGQVASSVDLLVRLIRQAETIDTDPDANDIFDSIRVVGDWNPRNGVTTDSYEDITFTVSGGVLFKREPGDAAPEAFADRLASVVFEYRTPTGAVLATPAAAAAARIGSVNLTFQATPVRGMPGRTYTSAVSVRRQE